MMGRASKIINRIIVLTWLCYIPAGHALSLDGITGFASTIHLNASTEGKIIVIPVKTGQTVKKGDLLIKLDATPHKARLAHAKAIEKSFLPAVTTAQLELERALELYDRDSLSQIELKNVENKLLLAEGAYQAAQAELALAEYELIQTSVRSPIDGRVISLVVNIGQYVNPQVTTDSLISLVNNQRMKAVATINSDQWRHGLMNKKATVKFRDKTYHGSVTYLGLNRIKLSSGLPAYEIHVSFDTDNLIPADMPVSIEIRE